MELYVDRAWKKEAYTIGDLFIGSKKFSNTLEDTDRGLHQGDYLEDIVKTKIYGKTAIPTGRYEVALTYSPKFAKASWAAMTQGKVPEILNVPGFSGIRIHPGSYPENTYGCLLVGFNTKKGMLTNSQTTYKDLMLNHLLPAFKKGEKVYITIL